MLGYLDELLEVNCGTEEEPQPTVISQNMSLEEKKVYINFLKKIMDVFAWTFKKMPDLNPEISLHRLSIRLDKRLVKTRGEADAPRLSFQNRS